MLSLIDLYAAGTIDDKIGGFLLYAMANTFSFLTAAGSSGTGKTTLLGGLLNFLKPGIRIESFVGGYGSREINKDVCYIAAEINDTPYYNYIWGEDVKRFFSLSRRSMVAAALHADTLNDIKETLFQPPLTIKREDFERIDLILIMNKKSGSGFTPRRRVTEIYGSINGKHKLLYHWDRAKDEFVKDEIDNYYQYLAELRGISQARILDIINNCSQFVKEQQQQDINRLEEVRKNYLDFYGENYG